MRVKIGIRIDYDPADGRLFVFVTGDRAGFSSVVDTRADTVRDVRRGLVVALSSLMRQVMYAVITEIDPP